MDNRNAKDVAAPTQWSVFGRSGMSLQSFFTIIALICVWFAGRGAGKREMHDQVQPLQRQVRLLQSQADTAVLAQQMSLHYRQQMWAAEELLKKYGVTNTQDYWDWQEDIYAPIYGRPEDGMMFDAMPQKAASRTVPLRPAR